MTEIESRKNDQKKVHSSGYFQSMHPGSETMEKTELLYDNGTGYTIQYVNLEAELQQIFALRYEEYCIKLRSLDPSDYPDGVEVDPFDAVAAHFSGKLNGEIVGASRLVFPVRGQFLMETSEEAFALPRWVPRRSTVEFSRFVAHPVHTPSGSIRQSLLFVEACCHWSIRHGLTHWVFACEKRFYDFLFGLGWPFVQFDEAKLYHGALTVPSSLDLSVLMHCF